MEASQVGDVERFAMPSPLSVLATTVFLLTSSFGQQIVYKFDNSSRLIRDTLKDAHVSGSLVYGATCKFHSGRSPIVPHVRRPQTSRSPVVVLQNMFSSGSSVRVIQEPNGLIRMADASVPTDILELKIHHVSFHDPQAPPFGGPRLAMMRIVATPEVQSFFKEHYIANDAGRLEGFYPTLPEVTGELNNVTVSQALDYVLKAFPGYWVYENCTTAEGER